MKLKRPPKDQNFKWTNENEIKQPGTYVVFVEEIKEPKQAKSGLWWLFVTLREVPPSIDDNEPREGGTISLVLSWDHAAWDFTSDFNGKGRWNQFISAFPFLDQVAEIDTNQILGQPLKIDVEMWKERASIQKCWPVTAAEAADVADYRECFK